MEAYTRPYYPRRPLICLDEISKQLVGEVRSPLPLRPGQPARYDAEYARKGVCNLFLLYEPLVRYREVRVANRRTRLDWAQAIKDMVDVQYPEAERIVLVMDQLNNHDSASLYEAFPPAEVKRLADKPEIH